MTRDENNDFEELPRIDESTRPRWQVPADRVEDSRVPGSGEELVRVHKHLRDEGERLLSTIERWRAGRASLGEVEDRLKQLEISRNFNAVDSFCSGYCELLTMHHRIEDRSLFPELAARDQGLSPVLRTLFAEHEVIAETISRLRGVLAEAGSLDTANAVKSLADHLMSQLRSHLVYEEEQLVPALNLYMDF